MRSLIAFLRFVGKFWTLPPLQKTKPVTPLKWLTQVHYHCTSTYHEFDSFVRYQKLEEQKIAKEHNFRMKQLEMEKEMRKEEREHELNMLRLLMAQQPASVPLPSSNPFNMPVSGFLASSSPIPATAQMMNDSGNTNYSLYPTSETPSYFKL